MKKEIKLSKTHRALIKSANQTAQKEIGSVEREVLDEAARLIVSRREAAFKKLQETIALVVNEASGTKVDSVVFQTEDGETVGFTYELEEPPLKPSLKDAIAELKEPAPDFKVLAGAENGNAHD